MIIVPICLRCIYCEVGMTCKKYPNGIPSSVTLANKKPEDTCDEFKKRKEYETTSR